MDVGESKDLAIEALDEAYRLMYNQLSTESVLSAVQEKLLPYFENLLKTRSQFNESKSKFEAPVEIVKYPTFGT